jgi:inosose dehydratase
VWFPDDDQQVPWQRFLDEVAEAGYEWIELGPYGYLPTDAEQLRDELGKRGLRLSGGAVFAGLHRGADALAQAVVDCRQEAELLTALGARHLVLLPEGYTDLEGNLTQPRDLTPAQWTDLTRGMSALARTLHEEFDVELVFHPHADTHVDTQERIERFLTDTDPRYVNLCLDTGHIAYAGGDNIAIVRRFPERVSYVHLKQVDPVVRAHVRRAKLPLSEAVKLGAMVEPPYGEPAMPPLLDVLAGLGRDLFCVIEQDLYPVAADVPLPVAARTAGYFVACGLGPVRRWPYGSTPSEKGQGT